MEAPGEEYGPTALNHYFSTVGSLVLNLLLLHVIPLRQRTDLSNCTILLKINCVADLINSLYNCLLFIVSRIFSLNCLNVLDRRECSRKTRAAVFPSPA